MADSYYGIDPNKYTIGGGDGAPSNTGTSGGISMLNPIAAGIGVIGDIATYRRQARQKAALRKQKRMAMESLQRKRAETLKGTKESLAQRGLSGTPYEQSVMDRINNATDDELNQISLEYKMNKLQYPTGFERFLTSGIPGVIAGK